MHVFVATTRTQGRRGSDFCFVTPGELVTFAFECDRDQGRVDGGCGCRRAMSGAWSHLGTTTFEVAERPDLLTTASLAALLAEHSGFPGLPGTHYHRQATELARLAGQFPPGTVLEKRGTRLRVRAYPGKGGVA